MQTLHLVTSHDNLASLLAGEKNIDYRPFSDYYISRLCERDEQGEPIGYRDHQVVHYRAGESEATFRLRRIEVVDWTNRQGKLMGETEFAIYLGEVLESNY